LKEYLKKKRDIIEIAVVPNIDYKNYLMLAYYRNPINHIFFNESIIVVSMFSFGSDSAWE
jgi:glycerol-3-phosphate O-acyltransferase